MNIFKAFQRSSKPQNPDSNQLHQEEFDKAIMVLSKYGSELEAAEVIARMVKLGITEDKAIELYLFIPTAFCREFIKEARYKDTYVEYYSERKQVSKKFKDNQLYTAIEKATHLYFHNPQSEVVLKVAGLSAEFKVINDALFGGSNIEDLEFTSPYIIR